MLNYYNLTQSNFLIYISFRRYTVRDALSAVQVLQTEKIYRKEEQFSQSVSNFTKKLDKELPTYMMDDHSEAYKILDRFHEELHALQDVEVGLLSNAS